MILEPVEYLVIGTTPLLMDNPALMGKKTPGKASGKIDPKEEAEEAAYINDDGHFYLPSRAFRKCIFSGTKQRKIGKASAMSFAMAAVFTGAKEVIILDPKTMRPAKHYEIDEQRGVNPSNGAGVMVIRPRFDQWAAIVPLRIDTELVHPEQFVLDWLQRGGKMAGVGAFRIENGGEYGGFEAKLHKWEKLKKAA